MKADIEHVTIISGEVLDVYKRHVCTNPNAEQLASIAISACDTVKALLDWEPRFAMVS